MIVVRARLEARTDRVFAQSPERRAAVFVALRDIRFAKGRFALMGSVVALITLLIVLLSGLTAGLANQSTSARASFSIRSTPPPAPTLFLVSPQDDARTCRHRRRKLAP